MGNMGALSELRREVIRAACEDAEGAMHREGATYLAYITGLLYSLLFVIWLS